MAVEIANAVINLTPSLRGMGREIERQVRGTDTRRAGAQAGEGYTSGFKGGIGKLTGVLGGAFAAVKIGGFAKDAISQASDLNEVGTKLTAVFGDGAKAVTDFSNQGAKALGQTSLEAQNAAATFGVFGKAAGLTAQDNAKFSTGLASLATDMASFSNTTPEQAIEALGAGLRGETEPLRAYGVLLDDASLRQEALSQGLITTTKDALTPQQKVLAAHALILKQTKDAQGDFARTSGGLANQQRILSAQWTDAKGKLGQAFLPGVTAVVSALNDKLFPVIDRVTQAIPGMVKKVSAAWAILAHGDFQGSSAGIGEEDSPLVNALFTASETVLAVQQTLASGWRLLKTGDKNLDIGTQSLSGGLTDALLKARDTFAQIGPAIKEAWSILAHGDFKGGLGFEEDSPLVDLMFKVRDFGLDTFDKLRGIWDTLWGTAQKLWEPIKQIAGAIFDAVQTLSGKGISVWGLLLAAFQKIADVLDATLVPVFTWLGKFMQDNPAVVLTLVGALVVWKTTIFAISAATKAWAVVQGVLNAVMDANPITLVVIALAALAAAVVWAYNNVGWFKDAVDKAWSFIKDATSSLWEGVLKPAFAWISENIHVVGDAAMWLWNNAFVPAFNGIKNVAETVFNFLKTSIENAITVFKGIVDFIAGVFTGDWSRAWDGIKQVFQGIWDQMKNIVSTIWDAIKGLLKAGWDWIKSNVFDPIGVGLDAVGQFFSDLWGTVEDVWGRIQKKIGDAWDWINQNVFAPMNLAINTVGEFMGNLWQTVQDIWGKIQNFFGNVAEGVSGAVDTVKTAIGDITKAVDGFFERFQNWGGTNAGGVLGNIDLSGGARGAVVPGTDPGRRDNMIMAVRSGESIFVPEFTQAIGGESTVHAWNRAAEQGRLGDVMGGGLARGGVVPGSQLGTLIGDSAIGLVKTARDELKAALDGSGGGFAGNGQWGPANFNGFAANTAAAKAYIEAHFPGVSSIGGLYGGSVPGSDHPAGKALDVMIANYLSQAGIQNGTRIADWFIQNPNSFGTKYVIWRDRINQGGQWAPYQHPSGNDDTLQHRDHVHISFLTGGGEFAGSAVGDKGPEAKGLKAWAAKIISSLGFGSGGDVGGSGVERWRSTALAALSAAGQPAGYVDSLLKQMMQESSGNPTAVQGTDINAQRGDPSVGLMQVIGSTFRDTLNSHGFGVYVPKGQTDPFANILASILYTVDRYGSLGYWAQNGYGAYDNGGMLGPNSVGVNLLNKPEAVLTPKQTAAYQAHAASLADGYGGRVVINLDSSDPLQVAVGRMIADGVDSGIVELASDIRRGRLQPTS